MSSNEIAINVSNLTKRYEIYATPRDRLKQLVLPALYNVFSRLGIRPRAKADRQPQQYFREFWALHDVSFQVRRGETVGIVGLNGSGKSTLLQLICSTLTPTSGNVEVKGRLAALLELGSGFNPDFTGRENVFLNGQILGLSREEIQDRFDVIEAFAEIGDFIDQPVKTYSSGMVVRLAFSVAINVEPEILVVDEALAVGDMPFQVKCFARLRKLRESGTSILFVSHDLATVRSFCDRAVYLVHGGAVAIGLANDVCKQYELDCLKNKFLPSKFEDAGANNPGRHSEQSYELVSLEILKYLQNAHPAFMEKEHKGNQSLTIQSFLMVGHDGIPVESVGPKQDITAYALLRLNRPLSQDLHVSIQIHDRQGMPLMVVRDSAFEDLISGQEGDMLVVSMCFSLPLRAGQYYCQVGALLFPQEQKYADGHFNFEHAEVADMVEHGAYIHVLPHSRHSIPVPVLNEAKMKTSVIKGVLS